LAVPPIDDEIFTAAILGRPLASFPAEAVADVVTGRRVLVTGAGGYIGSGLVRLIASLGPTKITLVENGEFALYSIDAELEARMPHVRRRAVYCDVRDARAVARCFAEERPDVVFHAAALKQLPLMEAHPREAVLTNTIGARNVANAALACGSAAMVLVSTDKAVHATSVLGATKRLAEVFCQALDRESRDTRFISVRFGNVFGSTGSVAPLFRHQIEEGGPVTLTDHRMTRYFMSLAEAAGFMLRALSVALSERQARGQVYLLETGSPVKIADIAERMIAHAGADTAEIPLRIIGARPGEQLHERLAHDSDTVEETCAPGISRLRPRSSALPIVREQLAQLERASEEGDDDRLRLLLGQFVPEFAAQYEEATARAGEV
jgi:FlaA1/EpsC-like NDP-sugar epimerase